MMQEKLRCCDWLNVEHLFFRAEKVGSETVLIDCGFEESLRISQPIQDLTINVGFLSQQLSF